MPGSRSALSDVLVKLEAAYGHFVTPEDPVEGAVMALLATNAPELATTATRDRLREAFVDWNELRVADQWDITAAMELSGNAQAVAFARAVLRFLDSLHSTLNRCSFVVLPGEVKPDWEAALEKVRAATPPLKVIILAMLDEELGGWHVSPEMVKVALKLGLAGKTTSATKVAQSLAAIVEPADRLRLQYLLARYAARGKDDPVPMVGAAKSKKAAAKPAAETAPKAAKPAKGAKDAKPAKDAGTKAKGGGKAG